MRLITSDGYVALVGAPILNEGRISGVVVVLHDMTQERQYIANLSWQATHDALTGLANRRELTSIEWGTLQTIKEREGISRFLKGILEKVGGTKPDPTYPVLNGATKPATPALKGMIADIASQGGRWISDVGLIGSLADTKLFDGGVVDDRKYQMESIIQLAASLPAGSPFRRSSTACNASPTFPRILSGMLKRTGPE